MASYTFDGSANVTASTADIVTITATPSLFASLTNSGSNAVLSYLNGTSLTILGANVGNNSNPASSPYPNVKLAGGDFYTATTTSLSTSQPNVLVFGPSSSFVDVSAGGVAGGVKAIFGGFGIADPADGTDTITIGGKGSYLVYGNAGADVIQQKGSLPFDASTYVTEFGGKGNDTLLQTNSNNLNAKIAAYGGEDNDSINIFNSFDGASPAVTAIFGGQGAADPTDGSDFIQFNGGGTVAIYGDAGDDTIRVGNDGVGVVNLSGSVFGGNGKDVISVSELATSGRGFNTLVVYGGESTDSISVSNARGTTVIYGDTQAADPSGQADTISFSGNGTVTIYAAAGNDSITLFAAGPESSSSMTVYGGSGADVVAINGNQAGFTTLTLGADSDTVRFGAQSGLYGSNITITDFEAGAAGDRLVFTNGKAQAQATVIGGSFSNLQQALDAATQSGDRAITVVQFADSVFVVANGTGAGFSTSTDLAVRLTGITDLNAVAANVSAV